MVDQDCDLFLTCVFPHQERLESSLQEASSSSGGREELLVSLRETRQTIKKVYEVREAKPPAEQIEGTVSYFSPSLMIV